DRGGGRGGEHDGQRDHHQHAHDMEAGETAVAQSPAVAEVAKQTSVNHRQHPPILHQPSRRSGEGCPPKPWRRRTIRFPPLRLAGQPRGEAAKVVRRRFGGGGRVAISRFGWLCRSGRNSPPGAHWFGLTEKSSTTRFCPERGGEKVALDEPPPGCDINVAVTLYAPGCSRKRTHDPWQSRPRTGRPLA